MTTTSHQAPLSTPKQQTPTSPWWSRVLSSRITPLIIAIIVLSAFFAFQSPFFLTGPNMLNIGRQIAVVLIVAFGITLVLITGEIDISMAGVMAVVSVASAAIISATGDSPLTIVWVLLAAIGIGLAFGLFNGIIAVRFRVASFIVTLGTLSIGTGLALSFNNGEPRAVQAEGFLDFFALGNAFDLIGLGAVASLPALLIFPLIALAVTAYLLRRTLFGIQLYATGGNLEASRLAGVPVARVRIVALTLCAVFAAVAGVIATARVQSGLPDIATGIELDAIAAAVLGGTRLSGGYGTVIGTLLGAVLIGIVGNGLTLMAVPSPTQSMIKGAVIVIAVIFDGVRRRR